MEHKDAVLDLIQRADEEEHGLVASLTERERQAVGTLEHWSARDLVSHLVEWKRRMAEQLEATAKGQSPKEYEEIDKENAAIYQEYHPLPWAEILRRSQVAQDALLAQTRPLSEETLSDPQRFPWLRGQPLWRRIAGNGFMHVVLHLVQFYAESGRGARAIEVSGLAAGLLGSLDPSPEWQGVTHYNVACAYALAGDKDKAIARLREALRMRPDLTEWSKQDTDLASLREEAGYRALYTSQDARPAG